MSIRYTVRERSAIRRAAQAIEDALSRTDHTMSHDWTSAIKAERRSALDRTEPRLVSVALCIRAFVAGAQESNRGPADLYTMRSGARLAYMLGAAFTVRWPDRVDPLINLCRAATRAHGVAFERWLGAQAKGTSHD